MRIFQRMATHWLLRARVCGSLGWNRRVAQRKAGESHARSAWRKICPFASLLTSSFHCCGYMEVNGYIFLREKNSAVVDA